MSEILTNKYFLLGLYAVFIYMLFKTIRKRKQEKSSIVKYLKADEFRDYKGKNQIIDVRPKDQFKTEKIHGARNIPISDIKSAEHKLFKDKTVFLYCNTGKTAKKAAHKLGRQGFYDIVVLNDKFDNYTGKKS